MTRSAPPASSHLDLLEQDEEHFQRFAESSEDVYWLADLPSNRLVFVSPQFERFWGVSRERLFEDPTLWNRAVFEEDRHTLPTPFFADDPASQQVLREYRIEGPGAQCHWIRDRRFHLRNRNGRTVRIGGIAEDVSVRKAREIELDGLLARERTARAEAEAMTRAKDEFLAVVTHELRSPLNAIRGWAHVLRRCGGLSEMQLKALDAIDRNTVSQAHMVDDLLDSQRILCGNFRLEISRVPLAQLIDEAVEAVQPAANAKRIQLDVEHDPAIKQVSVDLARLRQALIGLLSNAVKFTPDEGRIEVKSVAGPDEVAIDVMDNGIGLEPSQLPLVFDRFQQADASSTRQQSGLGLGLSLARQLVELHGGQIAVESGGVGCGARFTIHLPQQPEAPLPPTVADGPYPLAGKRIVIVEDDDDGREVLALILAEARVTLRSFDRASKAFDYLVHVGPEERPDVLISDIAMPDEDGYAFIRRVREMEQGDERRPHLVALALTAFGRAEDKVRALKAGFDAHMAKPIDTERVLRAIVDAFRRAEAAPQAG